MERTGIIKRAVVALTLTLFAALNTGVLAQTVSCPGVPSFTVNLTGSPAGVYTSPDVVRNGQCCAATWPAQCVYFRLTLDSNAAGIQIDMTGANPYGGLNYDINCQGNYPGGSIKCITGVGPHDITICKSGGNANKYIITSISRPLFPKDDTVRIGCKQKMVTLGIVNHSTTWNSIYPGTPGQYNSYLDSTNVASPNYSPAANAPAYVDYKVCGQPMASGCGFSITVCDTVRIYNFQPLTGTVTPHPATFCDNGPSSGVTVTASAGGGQSPYGYIWKNSSHVQVGTGSTYFASSAGSYYVEITDMLSNSVTCPALVRPLSVTVGTVPVVNAGVSQKVCAANPQAILNGTVQYATSGIWSGGAGTFTPGSNFLSTSYSPTPSELNAGFVKLYLTSSGAGGGCTNVKDSTFIYYSPITTISLSAVPLACHNSTTVVSANVTAGTPPYTYQWINGASTATTSSGQGNISVLVTDSLGCSGSGNLTIVAPAPLGISFSTGNASANGASDGSVAVNVSGGTPGYTVQWSPGSVTASSITGLPYGVYTATITDAKGCKISGSSVVNEPRCLSFAATVSGTNVSCHGLANGKASIVASGGTPAYSYTWNTTPPQYSSTAVNLKAGVYSAQVRDENLCLQTVNIAIIEPDMLTEVISYTNSSSIGGNDGAALVVAMGGSFPYSYLWSTSATTTLISNLYSGTYSVLVTDNKGCSKADSVFIADPPCHNLVFNVLTSDNNCFGSTTGSASAVVAGAIGSYTINWSTGGTGNTLTGLAAGNYSVTVTDSKNCFEYRNFTITQPSTLSAGLMVTNVSCNNSGDGTIDLTVAGGTYPYAFQWNSGQVSEDLANLTPGNYSVAVTDANGCVTSASASITQPAPLVTTYTVQNVKCIYGADGAIDLSVTGGVTPYTYTWSTGANTQDITGVGSGKYSVVITDANYCQLPVNLMIDILQPDSVRVLSVAKSCPVPGSGLTTVTVVPAGGFSGIYQVSYNNGLAYMAAGVYTASLANNSTYTIMLKDGNNCTSLAPGLVTIDAEPAIDTVLFSNCLSAGTLTTPVTVFPSGGSGGPYSISYTGAGQQAAGTYSFNLSAGSSYTLTSADSRSCASAPYSITIPAPFNITAAVTSGYNGPHISCYGLSDGSASVTATGGSGSYTYSWSTSPSQTTQVASGLPAGTFSITVKDANNCSVTSSVSLLQPPLMTATAVAGTGFNGQNISCYGLSNGTASVTANGGTGSYTYSWSTSPVQVSANATGLGAGTYSVRVSDANGCFTTVAVSLVAPPALSATTAVAAPYNSQHISCYGQADGSASVAVSGGTGAYSYSWTTVPSQTAASATGLGAGNYSVLVKDANNCSVTVVATLSQPPALTVTTAIVSAYNGTPVSCYGSTNGAASVTATGGTGAYTYSWTTSPVQLTSTASSLSAGTYSVRVTDANGCSSASFVVITQPLPMTATAGVAALYNGQHISCYGLSDGSASVSASGGTGSYTYSWSTIPAKNTQVASGLPAGTYTVTVRDVNNCWVTATVSLVQPPLLTATAAVAANYNGQHISCYGLSNGSASVTATGGTGAYTYSWSTSPVQTASVATALGAGSYSVVVKDVNNCISGASLTLVQPAVLTASTTVATSYNGQNVSCYGMTNGSASVTVGGGTAPFTYTWNTPSSQTTQVASNLGAGSYTVLVKDVNNCSTTATILVNQPAPLQATLNVSSNHNGQNISCFGASDGSLYAASGGGTGPYTYSWSTVPTRTTSIVSGLPAGVYTVLVRDANNCPFTGTIGLSQPAALSLTTAVTSDYNGEDVSCFGSSNGSASVTVAGGTAAYTYSWSTSPVQSTAGAGTLSAGTYSVRVTDANGCNTTSVVTLTQPPLLTSTAAAATLYNGQHISCNGLSDGVATVSAGGGTGAYSYSWSTSPVQSAATATGLTAGSFSVIVTDANNCSSQAVVSLTQPPLMNGTAAITSVFNGQNISCYGSSDGVASVSVTGGTGAYSYSWTTVPTQTTPVAGSLTAGTYSVRVTDANGCALIRWVTLVQPPQLTSTAAITSNYNGAHISCYGLSDGSASVSASGGTGAYTYSWTSSPVQSGSAATALPAGSYTVTVRDANNCSSVASLLLTQPLPVIVSTTITSSYNGQHISCYGGTNGSASVSVTGGTGSYTYSWTTSPAQLTAQAATLTAGTYTVKVSDVNGCGTTGSVTLTQPAAITGSAGIASDFNGEDVSCFGMSDGSATVTASGGVGSLSFLWSTSPAQTATLATGLAAGSYSVQATDENNCVFTASVTLTQPAALLSSAFVTSDFNGQSVSCYGANNGAAAATATGGTGAYTYSWTSQPAQLTASATALTAGVYTVYVKDINGCTSASTVLLTQPVALTASTSVMSNYNGFGVSCFGSSNGSALAVNSGGTGPFTYSWTSNPVQNTSLASNLAAGSYTVYVGDVNGCVSIGKVTITGPTRLDASIVNISNYNGFAIKCYGDSNGSIDVTVNGGIGGYAYAWSTGATSQDLNNLVSGAYSLIVTDLNGCTDTLSTYLLQPAPLAVSDSMSWYNGYNVSCNGSKNGAVFTEVTGGVPAYSYLWSNNVSTKDLIAAGAGSYTVTVTDLNGCIATRNVTVTEPEQTALSYIVSAPTCHGVKNASLNVTASGGVSPFSFNWSTGSAQEDQLNVGAGTYTVIYSDRNQCVKSAVIKVSQPEVLVIGKKTTSVKCYGDNNGSVRLEVSGGTTPYTYIWSNGAVSRDLSGLAQGTYIVKVTDAQSCIARDTTVLEQPQLLTVAISSPGHYNGYNVSQPDGNDGSIHLLVNGGTIPYYFDWSNASILQDQFNLPAGQYQVKVSDLNGCETSAGILLTEPFILAMPSGFSPNDDGKNDRFVIKGVDAFPNNKFTVFNRWGNVVYNRAAYNNEWDGNGNTGMSLPEATYFVILEIDDGATVLKGYVELKR